MLSYDTAEPTQADSPYNYSNPSYVLLGMLIEKMTGEPLATVLRRDLAKPAGLERAAFQDGEKPQPPLVLAGVRPGDGVRSSRRDARLLQHHGRRAGEEGRCRRSACQRQQELGHGGLRTPHRGPAAARRPAPRAHLRRTWRACSPRRR
ncbi:serine hydrolase [Kribbella orskensis]|uniref:serine hydrolase n=1 Tax=Kribbella TaxID=182639 RepID=UPI001305349F